MEASDPSRALWARRFEAAYTHAGLLVPLSLLALLGGAWLQLTRPELPAEYTWLQPFRVLQRVAELRGVPLAVFLAYGLGALSHVGLGGVRAALAAAWREGSSPEQRSPLLLRAFVGLTLATLDVTYLPSHHAFDTAAIALAGALLTRPTPGPVLRRFVLHTACAALVFTAVCYWFTVVKALTFVGSRQHDADLMAFEHAVTGIYPHRSLAAWAARHPVWVDWFDWAYLRIFDHMAVTAAFLIGLRDLRQRTEYLSALAICYLLGAPLYLLFPAAGPAYFDPTSFAFLSSQDLAVTHVQQALLRNTAAVNEGRAQVLSTWSYIACMPSLHMAHEAVMLFYVRASKPALALSAVFITITGFAVVALGWHYPTDIVGGLLLAAFAITVARWQSRRLLPRITGA